MGHEMMTNVAETVAFVVHAVKQFSFGLERLSGIADQYPDGTPPKAFYLSALYNYVAVFYLLDKPKNKPMGGAFYPSLERHGLQYLLDPIQTLLREPMGTTTFGEVVRVVRNKVVVHSTYRDSDLNLPRFRGHPRSHESAVGVCHGETEAAGVHEGVQGGGRAACPGKRQVRADRGAGTRSDGDGAAELGAAGGDRCRPGGAGRAHDRGAGGTRAAAAREPDAADGAGHPKKTVMGQGGPPGRMKVRYPHGAPCLEPSSRCGTASPQKN